MRHGNAGRRFNRTQSHRKAMLANLAISLVEHEQIVTTLPKAKDLRPIVEKLVTIAKKGDLAARRQLASELQNNEVAAKKFVDYVLSKDGQQVIADEGTIPVRTDVKSPERFKLPSADEAVKYGLVDDVLGAAPAKA